jgi:hypothetical protein
MIILYSVPGCAKCRDLAQWLADQQADFTTRNLQNPQVLTALRTEGIFAREAPVLQQGRNYLLARGLFDENGKLKEEQIRGFLEDTV